MVPSSERNPGMGQSCLLTEGSTYQCCLTLVRVHISSFLQLMLSSAISVSIICGTPTVRALPIQKTRLPSVIPVSVQPLGNVCSWSSSSGTILR